MYLGTALLAFVGQLLRSERRAVDPIAARARPDGEENVTYAMRGGLDEILLLQDADAHCVDERITGVAGREVHLATDRRDAHTVAVVADTAHDPGEQIAVARRFERAEAEAVEQCHRARAHRKDVAQDAPGARRCALVRFDGRRVVV